MQSSIKTDEVEISLFNLRIQWQDYANTTLPPPLPNSPVLYRKYHLLHQHHPPPVTTTCPTPGGVDVQPRLTLPGDVHKQRRVEPSWAVLSGAERKSYTQNKVEWNKTKMWKKAKAQKNKPHTNTHTHTHLPWPKVCGCGRATYLHICPYFCFAELSQKQSQTGEELEVEQLQLPTGWNGARLSRPKPVWAPSAPTLRPGGLS